MTGVDGQPGRARVPTGNTYDKYGSRNPVVRRLMRGFEADLDDLLARRRPGSILDVGCGEGVLTARWAERFPSARVVGLDLDDPDLKRHWARRRRPNLEFVAGEAGRLPFPAGAFELVSALEVLEHVDDPGSVLAEMARVTGRSLLVSVPREPLWRLLNLARGAYWRALGNTPGHVNHWSKPQLVTLLSRAGDLVEVRTPFPWTMALVDVRSRASAGAESSPFAAPTYHRHTRGGR